MGRCCYLDIHFNSQPHEEADNYQQAMPYGQVHFNSQPHEEADAKTGHSQKLIVISTHSLTKRLTVAQKFVHKLIYISTHSLTKRLTMLQIQ